MKGRFPLSSCALLISALFASHSVLAETSTYSASEKAIKIAQETIIVDGHIDVPYRVKEKWVDVTKATQDGDFDYPRAVAGGLNAPFMSIYVPASLDNSPESTQLAHELIDSVEAIVARAPDKFAIAKSPSDVKAQFEKGLISLPMGMENGSPIQGDLANLTAFYERGIRYITLAHSQANHISDSSYDLRRKWKGLSPFGKTLVGERLRVFTTRPDTLFGASYMVMSPEHPWLERICTKECRETVLAYCKEAAGKSDMDRQLSKEKTGVYSGAHAINPVNGESIPIWVADYVMMGYGTGAIMAVPAHDQRDWEFARKFELPIVEVISGGDIETEAWSGDGKLINSPLIDGLGVEEAKKKITNWLVEQELGESAVHYKLRDWLFSRQRYWGEPFPLLEQEDGSYRSLGLDELPLTLPEVDRYEPSGTGEGPLATISDWISVEDQVTGKPARRSSNTMPQWAGSCWYYLRFLDPRNPDEAWSREKEEYWMPVDLYLGGTEHAVLHLLYARFWHKVLYDLDLVSTKEPFQRLRNQGMILGENGEKMSKSRGNVVNPDDVIHDFGADSLRLFLMFLGPLERDKPWNTSGIEGIHRFLSRVWRLILDEEDELHASISDAPADEETLRILNKTIDAVTTMTTDLRFNTAISQMMVFVNEMMPRDQRNRQAMESFLLLLAPYAPHLAEELWQRMGHNDPLALEPWPEVDSAWLVEETVTVVVQVNGKLRDQFDLPVDADEALVMEFVEKSEKLQPWLEGKKIVKTIFVPGKLVNLVAK